MVPVPTGTPGKGRDDPSKDNSPAHGMRVPMAGLSVIRVTFALLLCPLDLADGSTLFLEILNLEVVVAL